MPFVQEPTRGDRVWWRGYRWFVRRRLRMGRVELITNGIIAVALRSQLTWDELSQSWLLWHDAFDSEFDDDD